VYRVHWIEGRIEHTCDCREVRDALNEVTAALDRGFPVMVSKNGKKVGLNDLFHLFWEEMAE